MCREDQLFPALSYKQASSKIKVNLRFPMRIRGASPHASQPEVTDAQRGPCELSSAPRASARHGNQSSHFPDAVELRREEATLGFNLTLVYLDRFYHSLSLGFNF